MKATLLFSAIFYLIGLKIGNTIESVLHSVLPAKPVISSPLKKTDKSLKDEKTYSFKEGFIKKDETIKEERKDSMSSLKKDTTDQTDKNKL
ncbi:hypothetical protein BA6E_101448 [Bacteroidales bacterium 6E]|jgi:hypothetical protein|nr:hypothetical protein BA6E_101448 [Bacteroidales bacterium 6E]